MMGKGVSSSESRLVGQGFSGNRHRSRSLLQWPGKMSNFEEIQNNAEELHSVINVVFQNIHDLSPSLRELVMSAKQYYKAMQNENSAAQNFYQTFSRLAQRAAGSRGVTRALGDEIHDIISVQKDIQKRKLQSIKVLNDEFILPLESWIESESVTIKSCQKNYQQDSKLRVELVDKARSELTKTQKKSQRSKSAQKYDQKEKQLIKNIDQYEKQLEEFRVQSCRKMLTEERKRYCFVIERLCNVMRSKALADTQGVNSLNTRLPSWLALINKNPEFPTDAPTLLKHLKSGGIMQRRSSEPDGKANGVLNGKEQLTVPILERSQSSTVSLDNLGISASSTAFLNSKARLRALFSHIGKDGSQLTFKEGDLISPLSDAVSGWQYGENLVSGSSGWFPIAYTEQVLGVPLGPTGYATMPHNRKTGNSRVPLDMVDSPKQMPFVPNPDYTSLVMTTKDNNNTPQPVATTLPEPTIVPAPPTFGDSKEAQAPAEELPSPPPGFGNSPEVPEIPSDTTKSAEENVPEPEKNVSSPEDAGNPFAGVVLKKTISNDRSAPAIS